MVTVNIYSDLGEREENRQMWLYCKREELKKIDGNIIEFIWWLTIRGYCDIVEEESA